MGGKLLAGRRAPRSLSKETVEFWDCCQGDGWESVEIISSWAVLSGLKLSRRHWRVTCEEGVFLALEALLRLSAAHKAQCIETGLLDGSTKPYRAAQVRTTDPGCRVGLLLRTLVCTCRGHGSQ